MSARVLVIGGGPAGSTVASLLAREGMSVQLLEKETFPRYHIGESISSSCRGIIDYLGALDKIDSRGYTKKSGVLMRWGGEDWAIDWPKIFGAKVRSWQVDRADFDTVLLDHSAELGAEVVQGATVKRVVFEGERAVSAEWTGPDGGELRTTDFDYVVDASGRTGLINARHFKNRIPNETFRNVAVWGYWKGGSILPNSPEGGINVVSSPNGWYWVIPLRGDRFSIGHVTHQEHFLERRARHDSPEDMLLSLVEESPTLRGLLKDATHQPGARVEQDFSYDAQSYCGPGYFVTGDSACFLDPLLSTGVHLAFYSGMLSAAAILSTERGEVSADEARTFYESLYRNAYQRLFTLVAGIYQQQAGKRAYFGLADALVREQGEEDHVQVDGARAFASLVSGLADMGDARDGLDEQSEILDIGAQDNSVQQLFSAADEARRMVGSRRRNAKISEAPGKLDAHDFFDAATGLYMVTEPALGIRKADMATPGHSVVASE